MTASEAMPAARRPREFLGHPIGLTYLFTTEMAERFSYYGMTAILVFYLTEQLLQPANAVQVIGFDAVKRTYEAIVGPLSIEGFASNIAGLYTGLVYFTPFFGGMLADRVIGQRYTVIFGGVLMAAGEFMLTQNALFFFGLLALIVGNGMFKPNISTQVGNLYKAEDNRIDRAYSIFYVGINIGATLSPLICGTLGEKMCTTDWPWSHDLCASLGQTMGWHFGFFAAGIGLSLGVLLYLFALRTLPPDRITRARRSGKPVEKTKLTGTDWKALGAIIALCLPSSLFWVSYQQQVITIALWARDFTNRTFIPGFLNWEIPATWAQAINPIMIFAYTPLVIWLWTRQAKKGREPSTVLKMAIGCMLLGVSFAIMAFVAWITGTGKSSWEWLLLFFTVYTAGELYLSPIGLAFVARVAPQQVLSMMMGFWFISYFIGNTLAGVLGGYWDKMSKPEFFLLTAVIPVVAGIIIWFFDKPLKPILELRMKGSETMALPEKQ